MTEPPPTFASWWDRLTYFVTQAQFLVAAALVALGVGLAVYQPTLPRAPSWLVDLLAATLILGPPLFIAGLKFATWLRTREYVEVYHVNGLRGDREKYLVAPDIWADKEVQNHPPNLVNDNSAFEVRHFEYHEEVDRLVVDGTWPGQVKDGDLVTYQSHFEEVHDTLLDSHRTLKRLRAKWHRMAMDLEGRVLNSQAEATERGVMLDQSAAKEIYDDVKEVAEADDEELPHLTAEEYLEAEQEAAGDAPGAAARADGGEL
jgi:hypothetical protein